MPWSTLCEHVKHCRTSKFIKQNNNCKKKQSLESCKNKDLNLGLISLWRTHDPKWSAASGTSNPNHLVDPGHGKLSMKCSSSPSHGNNSSGLNLWTSGQLYPDPIQLEEPKEDQTGGWMRWARKRRLYSLLILFAFLLLRLRIIWHQIAHQVDPSRAESLNL